MTITYYDKFAIFPKRCYKCNKLFAFEWYNCYERSVCPRSPSLRIIKCKKCAKEDI